MLLFAVTIGGGAWLLFQVQFILGKQLLPWFGGAAAVWTTCMLFFQVLLLLGYAYAHSISQAPPRKQQQVHLTLLALACIVLAVRLVFWPSPITPSDAWKPSGDSNPVVEILALLTLTIGIPFLVLSATGPLLQAWYARCFVGASPYRLYALSNLGSLLGLLSYPFVLEPLLPVAGQGWVWSAGFFVFAGGCAATAVLAGKSPPLPAATPTVTSSTAAPTKPQPLLWFVLAMLASVLLLAVTSQISLEVAVIPFLWMLPLCLYLLSFILCFDSDRIYHRGVWIPLLLVGAGGTAAMIRLGVDVSMTLQLCTYLLTLLCACMVCHGELVRRKPEPRHLTRFYLLVSAGGAAGGLFTGVLAPLLFPDLWELPLALVATCGLAVVLGLGQTQPAPQPPLRTRGGPLATYLAGRRQAWRIVGRVVGGAHVVVLAVVLAHHAHKEIEDHIHVSRGFFGVLRVDESSGSSGGLHTRLRHGRIIHGLQYADEDLGRQPTSYYGPNSGVGLAIADNLRREAGQAMHIGIVGLGAGTLACYAHTGDRVRLYEINPQVVALSMGPEPLFRYLQESPGEVTVAIGDARVNLEREPDQEFDVLALDAFSSDSIPAHLLTREAVELYLRHMRKPYGIIAVHISNRYLDLDPVVRGIAEDLGLTVVRIDDSDDSEMVYSSDWMLLAREPAALSSPSIQSVAVDPPETDQPWPRWTDTYSNLLQVFRG